MHIREARVCGWRSSFRCLGITFFEGMLGGLIIDAIGLNCGLYYFPREPAYSLQYWLIIIPCWGAFGATAYWVWERIGNETFVKGVSITVVALFCLYEGLNLLTGSWVYTVPFYFVVLGWTPLILAFVGCHRRRRVIFKVERLMVKFEGDGLWRYSMRGLLGFTRILLVAVMFPLWVFPLMNFFANLPKNARILREADVSVRGRLWQTIMGV